MVPTSSTKSLGLLPIVVFIYRCYNYSSTIRNILTTVAASDKSLFPAASITRTTMQRTAAANTCNVNAHVTQPNSTLIAVLSNTTIINATLSRSGPLRRLLQLRCEQRELPLPEGLSDYRLLVSVYSLRPTQWSPAIKYSCCLGGVWGCRDRTRRTAAILDFSCQVIIYV